jgi:Calx-beta domain-containing protein/FG-GAP repeat protein
MARSPPRPMWPRLVALISMLAAVPALLIAVSAGGSPTGAVAAAGAPSAALTHGWQGLSIPSQDGLSAAVGAALPSYRVRRTWYGGTATSVVAGVRVEFNRAGTTVSTGGAESVRLRAVAAGDAGELRPLAQVEPTVAGNRVRFDRGAVTEWYANQPVGLEQGFTVARPAGRRAGIVVVELSAAGGLEPRVAAGGHTLLLNRGRRAVLAERDLAVTDARGRRLAAWFTAQDAGFSIDVDASGAAFPLRIDPLVQSAELTAPTGASSEYGGAVAIDGSTAVVGDFGATVGGVQTGAAFVFTDSGGSWSETAELTPSDGENAGQFGYSVAISGSTIVVGAPRASVGSCGNVGPPCGMGAVYEFTEPDEGGWVSATQTAKLTPTTEVADNFGWSVAVDGQTIVGTAPGDTNGSLPPAGQDRGYDEGAAFIFVEPGTQWVSTSTPTTKLEAAASYDTNYFLGRGVAISGTTIAVTADGGSQGPQVNVFTPPAGGWVSENFDETPAQLTDGTGSTVGSGLTGGVAFSADGSTIAFSDPVDDGGAGGVLIFQQPAGGWVSATQSAYLTASDAAANSRSLGATLAFSGSTLYVGPGVVTAGAAGYIFTEPATGWATATESGRFSDNDASAVIKLAADGTDVIAGAYDGQAYLFVSGIGVSVGDASVVEPQGADTTLSFPVTLSAPASTSVTVNYQTSDGTATAGEDYAAASGALTIPPGTTSASIPVTIHDVGPENHKNTFSITLSSPTGGVLLSHATATGTILGRGPLTISVAWQQNSVPLVLHRSGQPGLADTIQLADADSGEIAQDVQAVVTVTNNEDVTEDNISINGVPALSYHSAAHALQALPIAVTAGPGLPGPGGTKVPETLSDLAPGASVQVTYTLHVIGNGVFDFSPQVLSSDQSLQDTEVSNATGTITALPTALLWLALKADSQPVAPGGTKFVSGTLTDRSLTQALDVDPVVPTADGNLGGSLHDATVGALSDGVTPPFAGIVQPGQTIDLEGLLSTAPVQGTRGTATFGPSGAIVNANGTETALTNDQIGMTAGSSPIDVSITTADPDVTFDDKTFMGNFTASAAQGMGEWVASNINAIGVLFAHPFTTFSGISGKVADFVVGSAQRAGEVAYLASAVYGYFEGVSDLTPAQRNQAEAEIIQDYDSTALAGDYAKVKAAVEAMENQILTAWETGDYATLGKISGAGTAAGLTSVEDAALTQIFFQKLALGMAVTGRTVAGQIAKSDGYLARGIQLQTSLNDAKVAQVLGKGVAGLQPGMSLLEDGAAFLIQKFGLTTKQITELRNYCQRSNLIIAVRQRSEKAANLIRDGLAVGKNEVIKIKAVNGVDVEYLGYSQQDLNTVVWAQPVSKEYVQKKLVGATQEVKDVVLQRFEVREKEWTDKSIRSILNDSERTQTIDWGFNGAGNGAPAANRAAYRRFALKDQPSPVAGSGRTYQQVLIGNQAGTAKSIRLVPISQDVDVMAILKADGEILSPDERAAAYTHLMDVLDMQHGETPTWIMNGEIMFQKKAKLLADVIPGGEPLAVFNPQGGVTAGFFDPRLTIFDNSTLGGRIFFVGGYNDPYSLLKANISLAAKTFGDPT